MSLKGELQLQNGEEWVELFELDLSALGGPVYRFVPETNAARQPIVWQGNTFNPLPIAAEGFAHDGTGRAPRPKLRAANPAGIFSALAAQYGDFVRAKVVRKRTKVKYLDAANFDQVRRNLLTSTDGAVTTYPSRGSVTPAAVPINEFSNSVYMQKGAVSAYAYKFAAGLRSGIRYMFSVFIQMDDGGLPVNGAATAPNDFYVILNGIAFVGGNLEDRGGGVYRLSVEVIPRASNLANQNLGLVKTTAHSNRAFRFTGYQLEQLSFNLLAADNDGDLSTYPARGGDGMSLAATSIPGFANSVQLLLGTASSYAYKAYAHTAGKQYRFVFFLQMDDNSVPSIGVGLDFEVIMFGNRQPGTGSVITHAGNNVYRIETTAIAPSAGTNVYFGVVKYTTNSAKGFRVSGYSLFATEEDLPAVATKYQDIGATWSPNPTADPDAHLDDDIYYVTRKSSEFPILELELGSPMELPGVSLPRRQIIANTCAWRYRSGECGYAGGPVANEYDQPTTVLAQDKCSHTVNGCKLRFGANAELPFGGFPGATKIPR